MTNRYDETLHYFFSLEKLGIKLGLENIRAICGALGHPERAYRSVIIGGTNGKGSVAAMMDAALVAAGVRTGRYTSPHLVDLDERYRVAGRQIAREDLAEVGSRVRETIAALVAGGDLQTMPTFFEATTAIAFEHFRHEAIEVALLEVGMGGRFDATNAVDPILSVITTIDLDHERFLGHTLGEIAFEKAGIIKPGVPVVVGEEKVEPREVIERIASERAAPLVRAGEWVTLVARERAGGTFEATMRTPKRAYGSIELALAGRHQVQNATVALCALEQLEDIGVAIGEGAIRGGLERARWPGRLELIRHLGRSVLLDAAHNAAGARALAAFLAGHAPDGLPVVFGAMRDKNIEAMLGALVPHARPLIATRPPNPRAADPEEVARLARRAGLEASVEPDPVEALETALKSSAGAVCVTGSIFLLGAIIRAARP